MSRYFCVTLSIVSFLLPSIHTQSYGTNNNCYVTYVVPRDMVKNTCSVQDNLRKRITSLEARIGQFKARATDLEVRLINQYSDQEKQFKRVANNFDALTDELEVVRRSRLPNFFDNVMHTMGRSGGGGGGGGGVNQSKGNVNNTPDTQSRKKPADLVREYRFKTLQMPKKGGGRTKKLKSPPPSPPQVDVVYVMAFEMLKPYVDEQVKKMSDQINIKIDNEVKPVSSAFDIVEKAASQPDSAYASSFNGIWNEGRTDPIQIRTNTLALSKVLPEMTRYQEILFQMSEKLAEMSAKVDEVQEIAKMKLDDAMTQKQTLEVKVAELEGENRLLKLNESFEARFSHFKIDMINEFMKITNQQVQNMQDVGSKARMANNVVADEEYQRNIDTYMRNVIPNGDLPSMLEKLTSNVSRVTESVTVNAKTTTEKTQMLEAEVKYLSHEIRQLKEANAVLNSTVTSLEWKMAMEADERALIDSQLGEIRKVITRVQVSDKKMRSDFDNFTEENRQNLYNINANITAIQIFDNDLKHMLYNITEYKYDEMSEKISDLKLSNADIRKVLNNYTALKFDAISSDIMDIKLSDDKVNVILNNHSQKLLDIVANGEKLSENIKENKDNITDMRKDFTNAQEKQTDDITQLREYVTERSLCNKNITDIVYNLRESFYKNQLATIKNMSAIRQTWVSGKLDLTRVINRLNSSIVSRYDFVNKTLDYALGQINATNIVVSDEIAEVSTDIRDVRNDLSTQINDLSSQISHLNIQLKLNHDTWIPYKFTSIEGHNDCNGDRYIKLANVTDTRLIVGVVLCSQQRYKIFLSPSLDDMFLDVATNSLHAKTHCELIGGRAVRSMLLEHTGDIPVFHMRTRTKGYLMDTTGQIPRIAVLSWEHSSPLWYECGLTVP